MTEYWVENLIQWAKSSVRYRTTKYPELVLVSDILIDWALAVQLATVPGLRDMAAGWRPQSLVYNFANPDVRAGGGGQHTVGFRQVHDIFSPERGCGRCEVVHTVVQPCRLDR